MSKIIVTTAVPRFSDAGTHMRCELVSEEDRWVFYIPWNHTQLALPACREALESHLRKPSNVEPFKRADNAHG